MRRTIGTAAAAMLLAAAATPAQQTLGLFRDDPASFEGYTLFAPMFSHTTYLIDNRGKEVHAWQSGYAPGLMAYLTPDGFLLRAASLAPAYDPHFAAAIGGGGRVELYDWDGNLVWFYELSNADYLLHHDIELLPTGNILMIAWQYRTAAEAVAEGRNPATLPGGALWPDSILEIRPTLPSGGTIVWEWHLWDHLVQDFDPTKPNFGTVADHPELVDLNYDGASGDPDWTHFNGIAYNPELDQIVVSSHRFCEFWVIDHSTTTAEAAGHTGGLHGRGGDLLYRWGNPRTYRHGTIADQKLDHQHDAQWIPSGLPGAGHFLVFNNGPERPGGPYSSVDEIVPPVDANGGYTRDPGQAFGPAGPVWSYTAPTPASFFSTIISGAQRQPNGNTLICDGVHGTLFEVTASKDEVWRYVNPVTDQGPLEQSDVVPLAQGPLYANGVFKVRRYAADYPGLAGKDLTPGDPIEGLDPPSPAPDGASATQPLEASRLTAAGDRIRVTWDAATCPSSGYNLLYGDLANVATLSPRQAVCGVSTTGTFDWTGVPSGNLFFLVVGVDGTGTYESSWGAGPGGAERNGDAPSGTCGVPSKVTDGVCF